MYFVLQTPPQKVLIDLNTEADSLTKNTASTVVKPNEEILNSYKDKEFLAILHVIQGIFLELPPPITDDDLLGLRRLLENTIKVLHILHPLRFDLPLEKPFLELILPKVPPRNRRIFQERPKRKQSMRELMLVLMGGVKRALHDSRVKNKSGCAFCTMEGHNIYGCGQLRSRYMCDML